MSRQKWPIGLLAFVLTTSGCATQAPRGGAVSDAINQSLNQSQQQSRDLPQPAPDIPSEVRSALMPPLTVDLSQANAAPIETRFDITVNHTPARVFFMSLVKDTPYNMVVHPSVKGDISLSLKNVTVEEVLAAVRDSYGFEFHRSGNGFTIMRATLRSQIFKIDYLNVNRAGISRVRVSSGQVSGTPRMDSGDEAGKDRESISGSEVNTRSVSDFWAELQAALVAIIGQQDGRKVVINPQSGILVVRAMPEELRAVAEYLNATQKVIQRQVILEAKIVEVTLDDGFQAGVNWSAIARNGSHSVVAGQFGGGTLVNTGSSNLRGQTNALNPANLTDIRTDMANAFGGMFAMSLNLGDFNGFLEFLKTQGNVHVLSSPRVSTVNNQKAVIKVGTDEFFVTDINTENSTLAGGTNSNQSVDVQLTPFFSGVALDVIPEISDNNEVTLHIHPSVSEVNEKVKEININNDNNLSLPLAQSTIRESDSIVRARSGQVIVIGGLMQNQTQDEVASVPILGDLPMVGGLFRHNRQVTRKTELVILLRPVVITGNQDWSDSINGVTQSFDHMSEASRMSFTKP